MRWLIRRLLIVWLVFCIVCAAAITLGRLDHTPTTLQTLGFDTCDGDPCFRGLKPGMDWDKARALLSKANLMRRSLESPTIDLGSKIELTQTDDNKSISSIELSASHSLQINAGN